MKATESTTVPTGDAPVQDVPPEVVRQWVDSGEAVVVDVRELFEHAAESIEGSHHHVLSSFDPQRVHDEHGTRRVVFACRTGRRSRDAACKYYAVAGEALHLAGGVEAWKAEGLEVARSAHAPRLDVMRQVQLIAGSMVVLGVVLGVVVSEWFLIVSGFVGAGLMFAGATGWCGMAILLGKMPWNHVGSACGTNSCVDSGRSS